MDGGFTEEYEWLVLSANSPVVEGPNLMSFVIYDVETFAPVNGMRVEVLIAHQSSEVPCCNAQDHVGPVELEADPENWPGDYSYDLPLDGFGNFNLQFTAYEGDSEEPAMQVTSQILVLPDMSKITPEPNPNSPLLAPGPESPLDTPVPTSIPTPTGSEIQAAGQTSGGETEVRMPVVELENTDGETSTPGGISAAGAGDESGTMLDTLRQYWYAPVAFGLIPMILLVFLFLRPSMDELVAQKEAELATVSDEEREDEDK